jgi:DNA-binding MarR family transcriptional regulator
MTRTYALKRLLEHGELSAKELIEITGWTTRQVWGTLQQLQKTEIVRKYPKMKWGLIDLNPMPY